MFLSGWAMFMRNTSTDVRVTCNRKGCDVRVISIAVHMGLRRLGSSSDCCTSESSEAFVLAFKHYCPSLEIISMLGNSHSYARSINNAASSIPVDVHLEGCGLKYPSCSWLSEQGRSAGWGEMDSLSGTFNVCVASFEGVMDHHSSVSGTLVLVFDSLTVYRDGGKPSI